MTTIHWLLKVKSTFFLVSPTRLIVILGALYLVGETNSTEAADADGRGASGNGIAVISPYNITTEKAGAGGTFYKVVLTSDIGVFTINGETFQIPRKYIPFRRNKKNGETSAVNLLFYLPEMKAESDMSSLSVDEASQRRTSGIITDVARNKKCFAGQCEGVLQVMYQILLLARPNGPRICPENGIDRPDLGLTSYMVGSDNPKTEREFLIKGDPCEPEDFLVCRTPNSAKYPHCRRFFVFEEKVLVEYSFRRSNLGDHESIARRWMSKLREFTDNP